MNTVKITMKKDSRLSFRISSKLDDQIEKAIMLANGDIRDRSEFGIKSVIYYLNYLASQNPESLNGPLYGRAMVR